MDSGALATSLAVAAGYLLLLRLVDFNEKEPLGIVLGFFLMGVSAAAMLYAGLPGPWLAIGGPAAVIAKELVRFLAIGAGVGGLLLRARNTGYNELNGPMDGVVYGASGGLGFATGAIFIQDLLMPTAELSAAAPRSIASFGEVALVGLADGIFGACMGIGFAAALISRSRWVRITSPLASALTAVVVHLAYEHIGHANSLGNDGYLRKWLALLLPAVAIAVVSAFALRAEGHAIRSELSDEKVTGAVSEEELLLLQAFLQRERSYLAELTQGNWSRWQSLHRLHNRQVQLAMAKHRARGQQDNKERSSAASEVVRLRNAVYELKESLGLSLPTIARYRGALAAGDATTLASAGNNADGEKTNSAKSDEAVQP